jgi:hypothetical protein
VITYLLQIKDRHNGNILLDRDGHLVHIDFGFMLANSPGNMGFEAAPFKLPLEYVDVLGGVGGVPFAEFRRLFREGFEAARKHCDRIVTMVELMQKGAIVSRQSLRPMFTDGRLDSAVLRGVRRADGRPPARPLPAEAHARARRGARRALDRHLARLALDALVRLGTCPLPCFILLILTPTTARVVPILFAVDLITSSRTLFPCRNCFSHARTHAPVCMFSSISCQYLSGTV